MKRTIFAFLLSLGLAFGLNAQNINIIGSRVRVDHKPYCSIDKDIFNEGNFTIKESFGATLIEVNKICNQAGQCYTEFYFPESSQRCETTVLTTEGVIRVLLSYDLIDFHGRIDLENKDNMISRMGRPFSAPGIKQEPAKKKAGFIQFDW